MKLFEIVGGEALRRSNTVTTPSAITPSRSKKDARFLAQGRQGMVMTRPKKTNMVTKVFGFDGDHDGYLQFLRMAMQHQDNPYLPRVSNLRLYDKEFDSQYAGDKYSRTGAVDMEKLIPLNNPRIKEVVEHKLQALGIPDISSIDERDIMWWYKKGLSTRTITPDEQFEEAMKLIHAVNGPETDLHAGNIMVRVTSTGPQLVLVDPIYEP